MSDPSILDNSAISNTIIYKSLIMVDENFINELLQLKTSKMNDIIRRLSVIIVGAMSGKINNKALNIVTDKKFLMNLIKGNINSDRLSNLLKFELDRRTDTSFEMRSKYDYITDEEYRNIINVYLQNLYEFQNFTMGLKNDNTNMMNQILLMKGNIDYLNDEVLVRNNLIKKLEEQLSRSTNEIKRLEEKTRDQKLLIEMRDKTIEDLILQEEKSKTEESLSENELPGETNNESLESLDRDPRIRHHKPYVSDVNQRLISIINSILSKNN